MKSTSEDVSSLHQYADEHACAMLRIADATSKLAGALVSANEADRNLEAANVVDGLFAIARALDRIADAINYRI